MLELLEAYARTLLISCKITIGSARLLFGLFYWILFELPLENKIGKVKNSVRKKPKQM